MQKGGQWQFVPCTASSVLHQEKSVHWTPMHKTDLRTGAAALRDGRAAVLLEIADTCLLAMSDAILR
jgi:hypothetical protein